VGGFYYYGDLVLSRVRDEARAKAVLEGASRRFNGLLVLSKGRRLASEDLPPQENWRG